MSGTIENVLILDGAQGTELERHGADLTVGNLWSSRLVLENPALIRQVHLDYLNAGADVITTLTYQASCKGWHEAGLPTDTAADGYKEAVDIAADARRQFLQDRGVKDAHRVTAAHTLLSKVSPPGIEAPARWPLVAFSSGSYGAILADGSEFTGTYADTVPDSTLADFHHERLVAALAHPEVDILAFETVPCLKEAAAIVELLARLDSHKLAWISFSCKDGRHTNHGEDFAHDCIPALWPSKHVFAVGVNCSSPVHVEALMAAASAKMAELAAASPGLPRKLLLTYPNSGERFCGGQKCWHKAEHDVSEPQEFADVASKWVRQYGVQLVGGCCRTTPEHISLLRAALA